MSYTVTIHRHGSIPGQGTFGTLRVMGAGGQVFSCVTVEREWKDNEPFVSCIPAESYRMKKTSHQGRYACWQVQRVKGRWGINMHMANLASELQGCIALGSAFGFVSGKWAVINSRDTYAKFMKILGDDPTYISITWAKNG